MTLKAATAALACALAAACSGAEKRADPVRHETLAPDAGLPEATAAAAPDAGWEVPRGCEINLTGRYRLEGRLPRLYAIEDDGEHVVVRPLGEAAGGEAPTSAVLDRGPHGLAGVILGTAKSPSGESCPVAFRAEVASCSARSLVVRSEEGVLLEEGCGMKRLDQPVRERVLLRE